MVETCTGKGWVQAGGRGAGEEDLRVLAAGVRIGETDRRGPATGDWAGTRLCDPTGAWKDAYCWLTAVAALVVTLTPGVDAARASCTAARRAARSEERSLNLDGADELECRFPKLFF